MIELLETRRLLSALPVTHVPAEEPQPIRIVSLEEFLGMKNWDDDEIVVEWYSEPSPKPTEGAEEDDEWWYELEEDIWGDVCDGPPDQEPLDDEDFALVEESEVLEAPIATSIGDDASADVSFGHAASIVDDVIGVEDDDVFA